MAITIDLDPHTYSLRLNEQIKNTFEQDPQLQWVNTIVKLMERIGILQNLIGLYQDEPQTALIFTTHLIKAEEEVLSIIPVVKEVTNAFFKQQMNQRLREFLAPN